MLGLLLLVLTVGSMSTASEDWNFVLDVPAVMDDIAKITGLGDKLISKTKDMPNIVKHEMKHPAVKNLLRTVGNYITQLGSNPEEIYQKDYLQAENNDFNNLKKFIKEQGDKKVSTDYEFDSAIPPNEFVKDTINFYDAEAAKSTSYEIPTERVKKTGKQYDTSLQKIDNNRPNIKKGVKRNGPRNNNPKKSIHPRQLRYQVRKETNNYDAKVNMFRKFFDNTRACRNAQPAEMRFGKTYVDGDIVNRLRRFLDNTIGERYYTYPEMAPGVYKTDVLAYPPNYHQNRVRALIKTKERNDRLKDHWSPG